MTLTPEILTKALSDMTRLRILLLLQEVDELCVCELMDVLQVDQPKISRHLALLRKNGIVSDRRAAQWIHYKINLAIPDWALATVKALAVGAQGHEPYACDRAAILKTHESFMQATLCR